MKNPSFSYYSSSIFLLKVSLMYYQNITQNKEIQTYQISQLTVQFTQQTLLKSQQAIFGNLSNSFK